MRVVGITSFLVAAATGALLVACSASPGVTDIRNVPEDYVSIQDAVDASSDGDSVLIAPGTYGGDGNTNVSLRGKRLVISGRDPSSETIIDADNTGRAFVLQSGEPPDTRITRLTLFHCRAQSGNGGAIFVSDAAVTIEDCVFRQCGAGLGGAVWIERGSASIMNSLFEGNVADGGGAVGVEDGLAKIATSVFYTNYGVSIGGVLWSVRSQVALDQCTCVNNLANQTGSVLGAYGQSLVTMSQSLVVANLFSAPFDCNSSSVLVSCTDSFGNVGGDWGECLTDQTGLNGNISVDPLLCGPDENPESPLSLRPSSPCLPGNHPDGVDCGLIGALGVGCEFPTAVQHQSWGKIKGLFR